MPIDDGGETLKEATRLKRAGELDRALELLQRFFADPDTINFGLETCCKLPSYLVLAGRNNEAQMQYDRLMQIFMATNNSSGPVCTARLCGKKSSLFEKTGDPTSAAAHLKAALFLEDFGQEWADCVDDLMPDARAEWWLNKLAASKKIPPHITSAALRWIAIARAMRPWHTYFMDEAS